MNSKWKKKKSFEFPQWENMYLTSLFRIDLKLKEVKAPLLYISVEYFWFFFFFFLVFDQN